MRKTKADKIFDFVIDHAATVRAVCLHKHITNVGAVLAYLIKTGDGKNLDFTNAVKHYNDEDYTKFIFDNKLNAYNTFYVSWNDIHNKIHDINFVGLCVANNLDANYIKEV